MVGNRDFLDPESFAKRVDDDFRREFHSVSAKMHPFVRVTRERPHAAVRIRDRRMEEQLENS